MLSSKASGLQRAVVGPRAFPLPRTMQTLVASPRDVTFQRTLRPPSTLNRGVAVLTSPAADSHPQTHRRSRMAPSIPRSSNSRFYALEQDAGGGDLARTRRPALGGLRMGADAAPGPRPRSWAETQDALLGLVTKRHREKLQQDTLDRMELYVRELDLDVSKLSVVHVAGTKGKGSTCTMVESILRSRGYRTALYTSPHLIDVRERIRIDGEMLSIEDFNKHFWHVHDTLSASENVDALPGYFRFLTCVAFDVFCRAGVDVVVLEVGLGGRLDATNIVPRPVVCGVTSLGLDHTNVLGDTIEEIALEKAGIFKPGVLAITSPQKQSAQQVLEGHAARTGSPICVAPPLEEFGGVGAAEAAGVVGMDGGVQRTNAALAVALCNAYLRLSGGRGGADAAASVPPGELFRLPAEFAGGLAAASISGRCQTMEMPTLEGGTGGGIRYFFDGAHTVESMHNGAAWFASAGVGGSPRLLVFYCSPERDPASLLGPLMEVHEADPFDAVAVCSNQSPIVPVGSEPDEWLREVGECFSRAGFGLEPRLFEGVEGLVDWLNEEAGRGGEGGAANVYVTGSLLLCGDVMKEAMRRV